MPPRLKKVTSLLVTAGRVLAVLRDGAEALGPRLNILRQQLAGV